MDDIKVIISFLNDCGIKCERLEELDGAIIERDGLLSEETYKSILPKIVELKRVFSSSSHTGLHSSAHIKQRWPLINIVRQVLRSCKYEMEPKRLSNGYTKDGIKLYRRVFIIRCIKGSELKEIIFE